MTDSSESDNEDLTSKAKKKTAVIEDDYDDDAPMGSSDEEGKEKKDDAKAEDGEKPEGGDENDGEDPVQETRIDVEVPKISTDLGQEVNFIKLPNFLSVDCRPFDPETYEDEIDDDDVLDEEGNARLKLKVENTMRWRIGFDENGKAI